MILDSSKVYLKGTSFFVTDDRTPQEQESRRQSCIEESKSKCIASNDLWDYKYFKIESNVLELSRISME